MRTVKEISDITGISVRTLHYYDEIGLLKPTDKSEAGHTIIKVLSREDIQKSYAKVVDWYGGKDSFLSAVNTPISKEIAESYGRRIDAVLQKLIAKKGCDVNSFEVREVIGEFGFVMKQFTQVKNEDGIMLVQAQYYRDEKYRPTIDAQYGAGASEFFAQAIEAFYKRK